MSVFSTILQNELVMQYCNIRFHKQRARKCSKPLRSSVSAMRGKGLTDVLSFQMSMRGKQQQCVAGSK